MLKLNYICMKHARYSYSSWICAVCLWIAVGNLAPVATASEEPTDSPGAGSVEPAMRTPSATPANASMQEGSPHWSNTLDSGEQDSETRILDFLLKPLKGGNIVVPPVEEFPRIEALDVEDPERFLYTWRHNLTGQDIPHEWDFYAIIATDRPDYTDATFSVGKGVVYWESGYTHRSIFAGDTSTSTQSLPEVLVRSGLTDEFELRVRWAGMSDLQFNDFANGNSVRTFGSNDMNVGFKYEFNQQSEFIPMTTFVIDTFLPTGSADFSSNTVQPRLNVVWGWGLRRWLYLKVSTGADFLRKVNLELDPTARIVTTRDNQIEAHQSEAVLMQFSKHLGAFYEHFTLYRTGSVDNRPDHFLDTGLYLYLTPNVQLDCKMGTRISNRFDERFCGAGFSVRY